MELKVIAYARNGHSDKFGIPRQSREESPILTRIVFEPEYRVKEALRGIEGFSHLWLIWGFSKQTHEGLSPDNGPITDRKWTDVPWNPTVRPPRLGGNKRVGVFATRSPNRPNPIGLSSVRLVGIRDQESGSKTLELIVSGADLLDGTPIYDIKPYLSFSDSHPDAQNGFAEETKDYRLAVSGEGLADLSEEVRREIEYILSQDPRPAYQEDPEREYKMDYAGWRIAFVVEGARVIVQKLTKI